MDSSIHAHLISQRVKDRIERAAAAHAALDAQVPERRGVRLPRIAWRHSLRRGLAPTALDQQ